MVKKKSKSRADILKAVAGDIEGIKTISDIEEERFVPTLITSFNRAIGIGGLPLRRMVVVHGKNSSGKSSFALVLAESMRLAGHLPVVFDTEHAAEKRWYGLLSGGGDETSFKMPLTMNEMIEDTNKLFSNLKKLKKTDKDFENIGLCFVIDTITKLMPRDWVKTVEKEGINKAYPIQALLTSMWMKYFIPVLYRNNSSAIIVMQDRKNMNKTNPFDVDDKPTGGEALQYDNSIRVHFEKPSKRDIQVGGKKIIIGWKNPFAIEKNKVDGVMRSKGAFFTGTGYGYIPKGLDRISEMQEELKYRGFCERSGNSFTVKIADYEKTIEGGERHFWDYYNTNMDEMDRVCELLNLDCLEQNK